jgi:hypothetical protein
MSNSPKKIAPSGGFLQELAVRLKLIIRLMGDSRVNPFLKILPIASIIYIFNPIDGPGPLDDAAVVGLGMYLFLELCPPDVVDEHLHQLRNVNIPGEAEEELIVDAEFHEADEED